jgi:hypothetical protein
MADSIDTTLFYEYSRATHAAKHDRKVHLRDEVARHIHRPRS